MPPRLTAEMIAYQFLAGRFVDLARAFAGVDRALAAAFVKESEQRIADHLFSLKAAFEADGQGGAGVGVLVPAAQALRETIKSAKQALAEPPH